jgi:hypothetical protein
MIVPDSTDSTGLKAPLKDSQLPISTEAPPYGAVQYYTGPVAIPTQGATARSAAKRFLKALCVAILLCLFASMISGGIGAQVSRALVKGAFVNEADLKSGLMVSGARV